MEEENPYFAVSTEALLPTPASCRSSQTPSPSGIHMAPSRPALRRDNITRNGRPEGKELRWTNPVGDASENPQDILPDSAEDCRPRAPQIPPAVHLSFDTPTYNGESAEDHNLYHNAEQEGREESQQLSSSSLPLHHSPQQSISIPSTPRTKSKWYDKSKNLSSSSLSTLLPDAQSRRSSVDHGLKHSRSSSMLASAAKKLLPRPRLEDEIRISVHIAETISRQRYLMKLCQALMKYGAPTHRLEEYMCMTARVLEIDAQFLYVPGCMFFSFGDSATHTTELKLLKYPPGLDLGRLADVHEIYKEVVHDVIGVEEAIQTLDEINRRKDKYNKWWLIFFYGCASACVGPFAFEAGALDIPIAFLLGCILGALKYLVVPRSPLYSNVFELTAAMVTSFLARAFGSIRADSGESRSLFCFPALAQSSIALILPGYMVLCSSLELQSRNMLAGSVRLVYSIIYSLVLGFGMMLGVAWKFSVPDERHSSAGHKNTFVFILSCFYVMK
ncbi:hypothetical protein CISG_09575 [Coccidioides immitis RMSCC 3703]|uniref:Threonine/serine exporter-like N-terminal domain-containing protein n=1 Tax=Coccidioides immitis RMSCC 3703 TaxID=454286 RepID=A0A0J8RAM2_COCIT|nr:hypothetical protein CISG_09575 [Coccidioides immitis RMSCC 3703]